MSNIDKTRENVPAKRTRTLPDPKEVPTLCLHVSEDAFFEGSLKWKVWKTVSDHRCRLDDVFH